MKKNFRIVLALSIAISTALFSCKKSDTPAATDETAELSKHSDDQARFSDNVDEIANDANVFMEENPDFDGFIGGLNTPTPCNATVVADTLNNMKRLTITYHGANCLGNRTRTGLVVISMPLGQRWRDVGATVNINIQNLTITRLRDTTSITINGTKTITNVTGGRLRDLGPGGTLTLITHRIESPGITVTFDNGSSRSWQIAKQRDFTFSGGPVITTTGLHTDGTITGISEWGTNRFGHPFLTSISTSNPLVIRGDCNFRLVSGQVTHQRLAATTVVTFGLDALGNPTSCPLGHFYMKIVWTNANGTVRTVIIPY